MSDDKPIIASTARVAPGAVLGRRVRVGDWTIINDGVTVGDDSFIGPHVILGEPTRAFYRDPDKYRAEATLIGAHSIVRAYTCIYSGVQIGANFECGSYVHIREHAVLGANCKVGTHADIQGSCSIGDNCRLHCSVHVTQNARIGNHVWLMPYVLMLNDPAAPTPDHLVSLKGATVGDYCVVMARAILMPYAVLGKHVIVAANARVAGDVGDWDMVAGDPARRVCDSRRFFFVHDNKIIRPYPWMPNWRSGYPWENELPVEW